MRKGTCNCIVLYDFAAKKPDVKDWYEYIVEWFYRYNQIPTRMSLGVRNVRPSSKTRTFKHYNKVIKAINSGDIYDLWIGSTPPNHNDDYFDSIFQVQLELELRKKFLVICFDNEIISFDKDYLESFIKDVAPYFDARYGICYQRDFTKGPGLYAYGVIGERGYSEEEEDQITKWLHSYGYEKRYQLGDLRDIYPLNVLSKPHLQRKVNNQTLEQWIKSSSSHGELKQLTDKLWSWWMPQDKISPVRESLRDSGIILCI